MIDQGWVFEKVLRIENTSLGNGWLETFLSRYKAKGTKKPHSLDG